MNELFHILSFLFSLLNRYVVGHIQREGEERDRARPVDGVLPGGQRGKQNVISRIVHGCFSSQSFWKAGSARNGSQSGSSLRRAGVTGAAP
jgi:hypothetical protein